MAEARGGDFFEDDDEDEDDRKGIPPMATYSIYVPGEECADHRKVLPRLGLGELMWNSAGMQGTKIAAVPGPDGGHGVVFQHIWPGEPETGAFNERNPSTGYRPDLQEWTPCKPWHDDDIGFIPAGKFWLGKEKARPPTYDDLLRPELAAHRVVSILNEHGQRTAALLVPTPDVLPHDELCDINEEGRPTVRREIKPTWRSQHRRLSELSRQFLDAHLAYKAEKEQGIEAEARVDVGLIMRLASAALAINYLVTPQVLAWLGWIQKDDIVMQVCAGTIEQDEFQRAWSAEKKTPRLAAA